MTIKEVRKLLGKEARGVSDEELQRDIDTAEMLKNIFFSSLRQKANEAEND